MPRTVHFFSLADLGMSNCHAGGNGEAGVYVREGKSQVTGCDFSKNKYGLRALDCPSFDLNTTVVQQNTSWGVLNDSCGQGLVRNCLIVKNRFGFYSSTSGSELRIWNSTIADNARYGVYHHSGRTTVVNSIVSSNYDYGLIAARSGLESRHNLLFAHSNDYKRVSPGTNDVNGDPAFVDAASGNYRLTAGSAGINRGEDAGGLIDIDLDGKPRPLFSAWDIGAYESANSQSSVRILRFREKNNSESHPGRNPRNTAHAKTKNL